MELKDQNLTLLHYKEPLKAIPKKEGYGYYGTILITLDKTLMQCHVCGELRADVGRHSLNKHKISVSDYKDKYQLARKTSLISESERIRRKTLLLNRFDNMTKEEKEAHKQCALKGWREYNRNRKTPKKQPKISLETKNKRGTCPDQLLAKIQEVKRKLKKTPSLKEFIKETGGQRYKHLIISEFDSWNNALKKLGEKTIEPNMFIQKYSRKDLIGYLKAFYKKYRKVPTNSDFKRGIIPSKQTYWKYFGGIDQARKKAGLPYKFWRIGEGINKITSL